MSVYKPANSPSFQYDFRINGRGFHLKIAARQAMMRSGRQAVEYDVRKALAEVHGGARAMGELPTGKTG